MLQGDRDCQRWHCLLCHCLIGGISIGMAMERRGDTAAQGSSTARGGGHDSSLFEERERRN